jgi:hypothetical protein
LSKPAKAGRGDAPADRGPITPQKLTAFLHHLGRTGSVTYAAIRTGLKRNTLYKLKATDPDFGARWAEALDLGVERLQDDAMRRALHGTERAVFRNGRQVGSVRQYDNRLLQFLLRAHRPEIYGDRKGGMAPALPFDLLERMAAAEPRAEAHRQEREKERDKEKEKERENQTKPGKKSNARR